MKELIYLADIYLYHIYVNINNGNSSDIQLAIERPNQASQSTVRWSGTTFQNLSAALQLLLLLLLHNSSHD